MTEDQKLSALLRLKRFEQPPAGYYEKLLQDVHRRQRAELLKRSLWSIGLERIQTFFSAHSMGNASFAGAMAAVAIAGVVGIGMIGGGSQPGSSVSAMPALAKASTPVAVQPVDLRTDAPASQRLLSLQESPEFVSPRLTEEAINNARLIPASAPASASVSRQPRYVIDTPFTGSTGREATKVSFSF